MHLLLGVIHAPSDIPGWHGPPRHRLDRVPEASGALVFGAVPGSVCPFPALFRPPSWMLNRVTLPGVGILPSRTGTPALLLVSSAKRCLPCGQGHTVLTGVPSSSCCREIGQRGQESNQGCQGKADRWGGRGPCGAGPGSFLWTLRGARPPTVGPGPCPPWRGPGFRRGTGSPPWVLSSHLPPPFRTLKPTSPWALPPGQRDAQPSPGQGSATQPLLQMSRPQGPQTVAAGGSLPRLGVGGSGQESSGYCRLQLVSLGRVRVKITAILEFPS